MIATDPAHKDGQGVFSCGHHPTTPVRLRITGQGGIDFQN
jgi:hypothetical protein